MYSHAMFAAQTSTYPPKTQAAKSAAWLVVSNCYLLHTADEAFNRSHPQKRRGQVTGTAASSESPLSRGGAQQ